MKQRPSIFSDTPGFLVLFNILSTLYVIKGSVHRDLNPGLQLYSLYCEPS
jgi:hypothetical protein